MHDPPLVEYGPTQRDVSTRSSPRCPERDETLINQYEHYAESAMTVSEQRLGPNRFYVSLLSGWRKASLVDALAEYA